MSASLVTLVIPALNEAARIAKTVKVAGQAMRAGVVDRTIVIDGGSDDLTAERAEADGIEVVEARLVTLVSGPVLGKGDSVWRALSLVPDGIVVLVDADLGGLEVQQISRLVSGLSNASIQLVKGAFKRVDVHRSPRALEGGRVTEFVARPALKLLDCRLANLKQPLGGQVAFRRDAIATLPVLTGYALEIGMLLDVWNRFGIDAIVEADIGSIQNRWKSDADLIKVADQVMAGLLLRLDSGISVARVAAERSGVVERPPVDPL